MKKFEVLSSSSVQIPAVWGEDLDRLASLGQVGRWEEIEGKDVFWSMQLYRIYGLDPLHIAPSAKLRRFMMQPGDWRRFQKNHEDMLVNGGAFKMCVTVLRADGSMRRLLLRVAKNTMLERGKEGSVGVAIDLTDVVDTSGRLTDQSTDLLGGAFKPSLVSALSRDASVLMTTQSGEIVFANSNFLEHSELSLPEVLGSNLRFLDLGMTGPFFWGGIWSSVLQGNTWSGELRHAKRNGAVYWTRTSITPILNDDRSVEFVVFSSRDITEQLQEASLREIGNRRMQAVLKLGDLSCVYLDRYSLALFPTDEFRDWLSLNQIKGGLPFNRFVKDHVHPVQQLHLLKMAELFKKVPKSQSADRELDVRLIAADGQEIVSRIRLSVSANQVFAIVRRLAVFESTKVDS